MRRTSRPCPLTPLALAIASWGSLASAQTASNPPAPAAQAELPAVEVRSFRGEQMDSLRYTRELKDTPQLITVLPDDLLQEQGTTSLRDALKNIPGISLQVGEGNPPSGDQFKIRGFNARDDIKVNGARSLGNYFRDPFYVDQLEVTKGPNSAFTGRGGAGGTVNFVTKKPSLEDKGRAQLTLGTDDMKRLELDLNRTVSEHSAVRLNLMAHDADIPGRDLAEEQRYGLHAAYTWGLGQATQVTAEVLHLRADDRPDAGLPTDRNNLLGTLRGIETSVAPGIDYSNYYGHPNDRKQVDVNELGLAVQHRFDNSVVLRNQTRVSRVHNDGWVSSPRLFVGAIGSNTTDGFVTECTVANPCARGETKPRDQRDEGFHNQTDVSFSFLTGAVQHDMVLGAEFATNQYANKRRLDTRGPLTSLRNPTHPRLGPYQVIGGGRYGIPAYDGTTYTLKTREMAAYAIDTMALTPRWDLLTAVRWDKVKATATRRGFTGANEALNTTHEREDDAWSYAFGLVHKLRPDVSLYASVSNAYVMSANFDRNSVQLAGGNPVENIVGIGFDTPPEKMRSYEAGVKWRVGRELDLGAAIFRTDVTNGRLPGQGQGVTGLPDNRYQIDGFEALAAGHVTNRWQLYAGYTYLDSRIKTAPGAGANEAYVTSQQLGGTPRHSFTLFSTYDLSNAWTVGGGVRHSSSFTSGVDPVGTDTVYKVRVHGHTVADLYAAYRFSRATQVRVNLNNAFDKAYIAELAEGGAQAIPGRARQLLVTLRHDF
ncbi:TonB-dependent receptor [Caldimonas sp.]|uniref:TonB-dependent receptor n=1 Tax=Caldimonas sp. TaxID=2838790 RepID=UPI00391C7493